MKSRVALALPLLLVPIVFPVLLISVIAGFGAKSPATACDTGPGLAGLPATGAETVGDAHLDAEQLQVATQIVGAVQAFPATSNKPHAAVVALATARQESGIRNPDYGDLDSLGAFQQRPSQGWGTPDQVRNVPYATTSFLKRLVKVPGWETMRVTDAAATVQRPAEEYEGLYEQWVPLATALTERLWGSGTTFAQSGPGAGQTVRLAHANLYAGMTAAQFKTDLARVVASRPDFVTLNETYRRTAGEISTPGYASWRAAGPFDARETPVLWRTDGWELVDRGTQVMHQRQVKWGTRAVNWVTLRSTSTGSTVSVISGHASPGGKRREVLLREFVTNLDALIGTLSASGPVLVGADLNTHYPRSESLKSWLAGSGTVSTFDALGEPGGGWATGKGGGIIDYILVSGANPAEHRTQTLPHSDHRMLTAIVNLTDETTPTGLFAQNAGCVGTGGGSVPANCSARGGAAEAGLTPDALRVMRCALTVFGPHVVGGVGERPNPSDHTTGRAVDIMIAGWDTPAGNAEGWEIAHWAQGNAKQLGVTYVIFDAKIWSVDRNAEGWRAYTHPTGSSNPTLDHLDHVHASVHGNAGSDTPIASAGDTRPLTGQPRVASFNVLGHSHTVATGERPGMAEGPQRMRWATQLLYDNGISVAGLQEFQPPQAREFKRLVGSAWGMYPGAGRDNVNAIVWRTDTWELVTAQSYAFPYFHGHTKRAPMVLLRHRASGQAMWFTNHHNPADARGPAAHWRREATEKEINYTRGLLRTGYPVVVTGDMNERDLFFCRFTGGVDMHAANGGSNNGRCRPPAPTRIDWIFASRQVRFSNYHALRNEQVRRTTDHPLIVATMDMAS